jgi:hypothetical protein
LLSFGDFAAQLRRAAAECRPLLEATLEREFIAMGEIAKQLPGDPGDPSWPPLRQATIDDKTYLASVGKSAPPMNPLLRTGTLKDSIEGGAIGLMGVIGAGDPKMAFHEFGTVFMRPRPIFSLILMRELPRLEMVFDQLAVDLIMGIAK